MKGFLLTALIILGVLAAIVGLIVANIFAREETIVRTAKEMELYKAIKDIEMIKLGLPFATEYSLIRGSMEAGASALKSSEAIEQSEKIWEEKGYCCGETCARYWRVYDTKFPICPKTAINEHTNPHLKKYLKKMCELSDAKCNEGSVCIEKREDLLTGKSSIRACFSNSQKTEKEGDFYCTQGCTSFKAEKTVSYGNLTQDFTGTCIQLDSPLLKQYDNAKEFWLTGKEGPKVFRENFGISWRKCLGEDFSIRMKICDECLNPCELCYKIDFPCDGLIEQGINELLLAVSDPKSILRCMPSGLGGCIQLPRVPELDEGLPVICVSEGAYDKICGIAGRQTKYGYEIWTAKPVISYKETCEMKDCFVETDENGNPIRGCQIVECKFEDINIGIDFKVYYTDFYFDGPTDLTGSGIIPENITKPYRLYPFENPFKDSKFSPMYGVYVNLTNNKVFEGDKIGWGPIFLKFRTRIQVMGERKERTPDGPITITFSCGKTCNFWNDVDCPTKPPNADKELEECLNSLPKCIPISTSAQTTTQGGTSTEQGTTPEEGKFLVCENCVKETEDTMKCECHEA